MKRSLWRKQDDEILHQVAGEYPTDMLPAAFNRLAAQFDRPQRTPDAIYTRISRQGLSLRPYGHWLPTSDVAAAAGIAHRTMTARVKTGRITARKQNGSGHMFIHRRECQRVAREDPDFFSCGQRGLLVMLLESEALADACLALRPWNGLSRSKPVVCVETGRRYPSAKAAALAHFVTPNCMRESIRLGYRANGLRFRWAK